MPGLDSAKRFFGDLTVPQRSSMAAAAVVILIASAAFFTWVTQPSYTVLYSGIDESQLSAVVDSLEAAGISYKLEGGGSRVLVPQDQVYRVRADLASDGIQGSVVPQGYELLDQQGLSVSDFRQQVDYQRALEGELARTLNAMGSVASSTVHLVIPDEALFVENQEPVTASVLIDPTGSIGESDIEAIVMLIASSVEGLEPNQVTVASTDGLVLHAAGEDTTTAMGNRQLRLTADFENTLATDINDMLASVLGPGRASVVVRAELDFDERSTESETYDPESQTAVRQQTVDETFTGAGAAPAGTVGVDGAAISTGDGSYDYSRNEDTTEYGIDKVVVRTSEAPGTVQRLSVAVVLDDGTLTGSTPPDVASIESLVTAAIGAQAQRGDAVEVSAVPFPAIEDATTEEVATEGGGVMSMVPTIIGALVLLIVAAALFLMSRGGKKRAKRGEVFEISPDALPGGSGNVVDAKDLANQQAMLGLTDDVIDLVERQPEEIATLLRSWLADRPDRVS